MTAVAPRLDNYVPPARPEPTGNARRGSQIYKQLTTTDHKELGVMYIITSFTWFFVAGLMALLIRAELFSPGLQFLSNEQFNQLFTMHGTVMLLAFGTPIVWGFANYVLPLQIGAPDVAFPRLNAFGFWITTFGVVAMLAGFLTPGGAADFGWTMYMPLADATHTPSVSANLWVVGVGATGVGTIASAVNMLTTVLTMRAPGMTMFRLPVFTWTIFVTAIIALMIFPLLTAAAMGVLYDRLLGGHICSGSSDTQRSTFLHCRSSASSLRSSRSSRASRSSATSASCLQPWLLRVCPWLCGRTTCSPPVRCCCRSSPS